MLRHHWEEDIPASDDVRTGHGRRARRAAPARAPSSRSAACARSASYYDVKIIIAESEIFSVHQQNLIARPRRLRRRLPLARAARRALHRQRLRPGHPRAPPDDGRDGAALRSLRRLRHRRHGRGAAADRLPQRLVLAEAERAHGVERHRPAGARAAQRLRARTACRSACRSSAGRSARPTILRVGHAYERATEWHARRPALVPGAEAPGGHAAARAVGHRRSGRRRDARSLRRGRPARGAARSTI